MSKTPKTKHIKDKNIPIRTKILVISDSLSAASDKDREKSDISSKVAIQLIQQHGYQALPVEYLPDETMLIQETVSKYIDQHIELVITIGGTGIAPRDVTIDAIEPLLHKMLPGFGELFRNLTYQEVGTVSIMTRSIAGICNETVIVCLPGSSNAVKLGVNLIFQEILHLINLLKKSIT